MRHLVIGLIAILATPSQAETQDATKEDYCFQVLKTANSVMAARQADVSIHKLWDNQQSEFISKILVDAYSSHIYLTDDYKKKSADEFAVKYYVDCMRNHEW